MSKKIPFPPLQVSASHGLVMSLCRRVALSTTRPTSALRLAVSGEVSDDRSDITSLEDYVKDRGGNLPIRKVLIASNGMAATKSILSMRQWAYMELGDRGAIQFVAMATPEDIRANAEFVRLADSFVEVPGGKNLNNYANVTVITQVAKEQGEYFVVVAAFFLFCIL